MDGLPPAGSPVLMKKKRHRTIDPAKARAAVGGDPGWYAGMSEPEATRKECSNCGKRAKILDPEFEECIGCRVRRTKQARTA